MNKHPHVYKTFVRAVVLRTLCFALLLGSFALTAKAGPNTSPSFSPSSTISGKVTDSKNAPLEGASITIKGTKRGTTTNATGVFTLQNVPDNAVLVISFSGYKTQELPVKGRTSYNVALETDISNLSDVVVYIGYGTTTKKDATGAISQVKATQLENENPRSVQDILRGNAPGLDVSFDASTKGSSASLLVRGKGSLKASNSPLIVLNGSIFGGQLADLNPNDIATIDVLKDASASAIYGAQASNGVIVVTTKKGKIGKAVITFNDNIGINKVTRVPELLNAQQFLNWRQDVLWSQANFDSTSKPGIQYKFWNPNSLPSSITLAQWISLGSNSQQSNAADPVASWLYRLNLNDLEIANYKANQSIDFNKVYYNSSALQHDHTVSISQRKEDFNLYFSLGYLQNQGITNGEKPYQTYRSNLNIESKIASYLTLSANINFSERNESGITMSQTNVENSSPWGTLYNPDGSPTLSVQNDPAVSTNPIFAQQLTDRVYKYDNLYTRFSASGKLPYGFSYEVAYAPSLGFTQQYNHVAVTSVTGGFPVATRTNNSYFNWLLDNTLRWNGKFGKHSIGAQITQTAEKNQSWGTSATASGFSPNDALSYHNLGAGTQVPVVSSSDGVTTGAATTGRVTYDYNKRYYLTGTFRRDGYSGFGANYPYANFYSVGTQWAFSDENFMKSTSKWLDYGKLRVTYGQNGNRSIPDPTATLYLLGTGSYSYGAYSSPYNLAIVYANSLANPNLQWEKKAGWDIGLDYSILKNLVSGSIELYKNTTSNLLVQRTLPPVSGFTSIWANLGGVQNTGLEVSINTQNMKRKDFEWNTSFSFWLDRNQITHLYGATPIYDASGKQIGTQEKSDTANGWFIGHSIDAIYDYQVTGVWQTKDAATAKTYNQSPGDFRVQDVNGDGKIDASHDKTFQGQTAPLFSWQMRNEFRIYKNFDFSFTLYSRLGQKSSAVYRYNNAGFYNRSNFYARPYWTPSNPLNDYARMFSYNAAVGSQNYISSSFVRLSNISLAYSIPSEVLQRWKIQGLKVYVNVVNAAVFSNWNWYDPENQGPTPMTYNFGLNLTL